MSALATYKKELGKRIHGLRAQNGMSLRSFGLLSGVHYNQLHNIEKGETNPSLETLFRIAEGLDMTVSELLDTKK